MNNKFFDVCGRYLIFINVKKMLNRFQIQFNPISVKTSKAINVLWKRIQNQMTKIKVSLEFVL